MNIKSFSSHYNGKIDLQKDKNGYTLLVNSYMQSGRNIEFIWDETFDQLIPKLNLQKILLFGFAGGSIITPLRKKWPDANITAIEIDPVMIKLAREYFPQNTKGVKLINGDAIKFITKLKAEKAYDLVIVDCYIGSTQPQQSTLIPFLVKLKILAGTVLLNQLFLPNQKNEIKKIAFLKTLDTLYSVKILKLPYNIIIEF